MKRLVLSLAAALAFGSLSAPSLAASTMSTMPTCAAGDPVVWVNTSTKVFHTSGDSYYGKTKHGKYACQSAAVAMGAHVSKHAKSGMSGGAMSGGATSGSSMSGCDGSTTHKKKKHHKSMDASPAPASTM